MNTKIITIVKYFVLLLIAGVLLVFAFRGMSVNKILQGILQADLFWVTLSGIISIVAFIVRAHRWNLLIKPLGYTPSLKRTTYSLMVGYLANLAFPRLGEVSRCAALSKAESIPFNKLLGTVIVERIIDVISLLLCILLAAIAEYKRLGKFFTEKIFDPLKEKIQSLTSSPLLMIVAALLLVTLLVIIFYFYKKYSRKGAASGINKIIKGFIDGLRSAGNLKQPGLFIFQSVFIWVLYFLSVYTALFAFPFTTDLGAGAALFLLVAGGIGMSAPVQGGIGAYHLLVTEGLILYGIPAENGLAFAFTLHGLQIILVVLLGSLSLFLLFSINKNKPVVQGTNT
ncbi:MAG TPA: lysylphosphatidylglycerol synthase transmembrane domain-containing protein [Chitinophagaceae bacterium]